jgi:hypothetical protein
MSWDVTNEVSLMWHLIAKENTDTAGCFFYLVDNKGVGFEHGGPFWDGKDINGKMKKSFPNGDGLRFRVSPPRNIGKCQVCDNPGHLVFD